MKLTVILMMVSFVALAASQQDPASSTEPSETTSTPKDQTTTSSTSTSTTEKTTTTSEPTSTSSPSTTTEHVTTSKPSTTPEPVTTTVKPTPSPIPNPKTPSLKNYTLTKTNGEVCVVLVTRLAVTETLNNTKASLINFVNGTVNTDGSTCDDKEIHLIIDFPEQRSNVTVVFSRSNTSHFISELQVRTDSIDVKKDKLVQFEVPKDKYYKCSQKSEVDIGEKLVYLIFSDMQYEAFRTSKNGGFVGSEQECAADYRSDVVIIAIGCALALLVVIILVAYLIARRKNRQSGYQSV